MTDSRSDRRVPSTAGRCSPPPVVLCERPLLKDLGIDAKDYEAYQTYIQDVAGGKYISLEVFEKKYKGYFRTRGEFVSTHCEEYKRKLGKVCPWIIAYIDWDAIWNDIYSHKYTYIRGYVYKTG